MHLKPSISLILLVLAGAAPAWAQSTPAAVTSPSAAQSVLGGAGAYLSGVGFTNSFNPVNAVATAKLSGAVSNVSVQQLGNQATANGSGGAGGNANGGTGGTAVGSSGASGTGGKGGSSTMGAGYNADAGAGGGVGAVGAAGTGGTANAGTLNLYNSLSSTAQSAAGIVMISQNSGVGALTQQSVTVQANTGLGK